MIRILSFYMGFTSTLFRQEKKGHEVREEKKMRCLGICLSSGFCLTLTYILEQELESS
jgi:hypothetical protein